jgi:hypothetical protein
MAFISPSWMRTFLLKGCSGVTTGSIRMDPSVLVAPDLSTEWNLKAYSPYG